MTSRLWLAILILVALAAEARAVPITIANSSFEVTATTAGTYNYNFADATSGPSWLTASPGSGSTGVNRPHAPLAYGDALVTDGAQTGFTNGPSIWQVLTTSFQPNTDYTLSVDVMARQDYSAWTTTYRIEFYAGTTLLDSDSNTIVWGNGTFTHSVIHVAGYAPSNSIFGGNPPLPLKIVLMNIGPTDDTYHVQAQINFDNVRLDATATVPEPTTLTLAALAAPALALRRRRAAA